MSPNFNDSVRWQESYTNGVDFDSWARKLNAKCRESDLINLYKNISLWRRANTRNVSFQSPNSG